MNGTTKHGHVAGSITILLILISLFACSETEVDETSQPLPTITTAVTPVTRPSAEVTATQTRPQLSPVPSPTPITAASSTPILTATNTRPPPATPAPAPTEPPTAPYGPLEVIGQLGGYTGAVASHNDYVYLGSGRRMIVLDMTNPAQLVVRGQTTPLPGLIQAITVVDDYAYVAVAGSGLHIFQVADPSNPAPVGFFPTGTRTADFEAEWDLALVGTHVYLLDDTREGMTIIDVSDPANPVETGFYTLSKSGLGLAVTETHAYIAGGESGLFIVDVSDPGKPTQMGHLGQRAWDVAVHGRHAYVVNGQQQMAVVDVSDPTSPLVVAAYETENMSLTKVTAVDNRLYLSDSFGSRGTTTIFYQYGPPAPSGQLHLLDITDPARPRETGTYNTAAPIWSAAFTSEYALLASGSLHVIHVADPAAPTAVGLMDKPIDEPEPYWAAQSLSTGENRLYAVVNGTLYSVDPANATDLLEVATSATGRVSTVAVKAPYLYIAAQEGLTITDVSNPAAGEVGFASYDTLSAGCTREDSADGHSVDHMAVADGYAYVNYVDYFGDGKHSTLCVIDVSDPEAPTAVGFYDVPGNIRGIEATETAVYAATSRALVILETADPTALTVTGRLPLPGWDVAVDGQIIYLAAGAEGLYILHLE